MGRTRDRLASPASLWRRVPRAAASLGPTSCHFLIGEQQISVVGVPKKSPTPLLSGEYDLGPVNLTNRRRPQIRVSRNAHDPSAVWQRWLRKPRILRRVPGHVVGPVRPRLAIEERHRRRPHGLGRRRTGRGRKTCQVLLARASFNFTRRQLAAMVLAPPRVARDRQQTKTAPQPCHDVALEHH